MSTQSTVENKLFSCLLILFTVNSIDKKTTTHKHSFLSLTSIGFSIVIFANHITKEIKTKTNLTV